ncbi:MAG: chromosome partitioning protein ParB [Woeseia sp.]|nr:chromosome partitioning protein ParB [Woeseia sp.]|tara:strand:+ start:16704 stop:17597 length:894 start_codon:yes stop_codon:yes gene_type:complete
MSPKKRLGRGLDALLSKPMASVFKDNENATSSIDTLKNLPLEYMQRGQYQPRVDMRQDSLEELAASIKSQGVVQPIIVRPVAMEDGLQRYEIIAGERRWRAAQMAGLSEIPVVIRDVPDDAAIAMALIENIQRENLNPLEEARSLDRLINEFNLTHAEAAAAVGRSRTSVSNLLRLQELSDKVKDLLENRKIDMGHARALLSILDAKQQYEAAMQIINKKLSVRETESFVKRITAGGNITSGKKSLAQNPDLRRLEIDISEKLGAKVSFEHFVNGKGKLIINYNNLDELDGILKHIR